MPTLSPKLHALLDEHASLDQVIRELENVLDLEWEQLTDEIFTTLAASHEVYRTAATLREKIHATDNTWPIEGAARRAGFIVGFEYARRLFTTGGAR